MKKLDIPENKLRHLYEEEEMTTFEVADYFGCCQATVWKRLGEYGIKPRLPGTPRVDFTKEDLEIWYLEEGLSTWEIEKQYGYPRGTVHRKLKEWKIPSRSRAESHIAYPFVDFNGGVEEKAYMLGFSLGDLRVRKKHPNSEVINVDCGSTKSAQIELIKRLFSPYGHVWIKEVPSRPVCFQVECTVNSSFGFLLDRSVDSYGWVFEARETFAPFLAGFLDAEGCVSVQRLTQKVPQAYCSIGNYDADLLRKIRERLVSLGIQCPELYVDRKRRVAFEYYRRKSAYWQLNIVRKNSLLMLFDLITPHTRHRDKKRAIKRAKENIEWRNAVFDKDNQCFTYVKG